MLSLVLFSGVKTKTEQVTWASQRVSDPGH